MAVNIVMTIESVMHVSITTVGIRGSPGVGVVVVMGGACKYMGGEMWGHLPHACHTAHVPLTDVLVEGRRQIEHSPARRHAAEGGREVRSRHTAGAWDRAGSDSGADGGMAGINGW